MNREEAKEYLSKIAHSLGGIGVEYYTEKDGDKMIEAINVLYYGESEEEY